LYAARLHYRDPRRAWQHAGCAHRRVAGGRLRSARGLLHRSLAQEHVQLRAPDLGSACAAAGAARPRGMSRGAILALGALLAVLLALPVLGSSYVVSVMVLVLFAAYLGQAWNIMMGYVGLLSIGHALYVGLGAYTAAALFVHYGLPPWLGMLAG